MTALLFALFACGSGEPDDTSAAADDTSVAADDTSVAADDTSASDDTSAGDDTSAEDSAAEAPTWHADVEPILSAHCFGCHAQALNITGLPLDDYALAAAMAEPVAEAAADRSMPLWPADPDCGDLINPNTLTDDAIATLAAWAEAGAPEGDPDDAPPPVEEDPIDWDVEVAMAPYTPDQEIEDEYRCFVLDPQIAADTMVTGFEVDPGNDAVVHHVILYTDPDRASLAKDASETDPGYTCFGTPGLTNTAVLGGWVPGPSPRTSMPEGKGLELKADSLIVMEIHYHPDADHPEADETALKLQLDDSADPLYTYFVGDWSLNIPAGESEHLESATTSFDFMPFDFDVQLYGIVPHMHLLGDAITFTVLRADGTEECAVSIPEWDFEFQQTYWYEEPLTFSSDEEVRIECVYDNSADNPDNPNDPPEDVRLGEGTADEMCLGYVMFDILY